MKVRLLCLILCLAAVFVVPASATETTYVPGTMPEVVTSILGEYQPQTYIVNQYASDGTLLSTSTEIVPGLAGLDYPWLVGAGLFAIMLYGILRIIGGLLKL